MRAKTTKRLIFIIIVLVCFSYRAARVYKHYLLLRILNKSSKFTPFKYKATAVDTTFSGYLLMTPYKPYNWRWGQMTIMNAKGEVLLNRHFNGYIYDFKQWLVNGRVLYSYMYDDVTLKHTTPGLAEGTVVILDSLLNEIKKVHLIPHNDVTNAGRQGLNMHDFLLIGENHYITLLHYIKQVNNIPDSIRHSKKLLLAVPILQEIVNDSVVWQWDASQFPEFYAHSRHGNNYTDSVVAQDYMHMNAVWLDPRDSNLIVSFRNECQVIKVSRKTGDILWRLGGANSDFPLIKEQYFIFQHNPRLIDSNRTLMLLDNGDSVTRPSTRVLEFRLDEMNKKALSFSAFTLPEKFSTYMGSVEKYGDDYLVSGGSSPYILLINRKTGKKRLEIKGNLSTYRVQHVDNIFGLNHIIKLKRRRR